MQYGPIMDDGVRARCDAAVRYRTILRVQLQGAETVYLKSRIL